MDLKLEDGNFVLDAGGVPQRVQGMEEMLQNIRISIALPKGSFPYGRELGSGLAALDPEEEHSEERAAALGNEALLDWPGVCVTRARREGAGWRFFVDTPLGKGQVVILINGRIQNGNL